MLILINELVLTTAGCVPLNCVPRTVQQNCNVQVTRTLLFLLLPPLLHSRSPWFLFYSSSSHWSSTFPCDLVLMNTSKPVSEINSCFEASKGWYVTDRLRYTIWTQVINVLVCQNEIWIIISYHRYKAAVLQRYLYIFLKIKTKTNVDSTDCANKN